MALDDEIDQISQYVVDQLSKHHMMVATAESCTGGMISAAITSVAGSSNIFDRSFITYSNQAKTEMLGVPDDLLAEFGAVSSQVAMAMAAGCLENSNAQIVASVTGIAGPGGGSEEKPVGTVFVAIAGSEGMFVEELQLGDIGRAEVRRQTVIAVLEMIVAFGLPDDEHENSSVIH